MLDTASDGTVYRVAGVVAQLAERHDIAHRFVSTDPLVDSGFTSMAMVELMLAIEVEFDMMIPQPEMKPGNFRSISSLAQMLQRLRAGT